MMRNSFVWVGQFVLLVVVLQTVECAKKPLKITWKQFSNAITANGFPQPSESQYEGFVHTLKYAGITKKMEAAMFLAQLIHESGGLQFKEELAYKDKDDDPYKTPSLDVPGKRYYGRGYIQLSWAENYLSASKGIYGDDRLLQNPDLVAKDEDAAFLTAGWYWKTRVGSLPGVQKGRFGDSTRAINGVVECNGEYLENSKNRFKYYKVVFEIFGAKGTPDERGCYN